jgi:hypothetical protein
MSGKNSSQQSAGWRIRSRHRHYVSDHLYGKWPKNARIVVSPQRLPDECNMFLPKTENAGIVVACQNGGMWLLHGRARCDWSRLAPQETSSACGGGHWMQLMLAEAQLLYMPIV